MNHRRRPFEGRRGRRVLVAPAVVAVLLGLGLAACTATSPECPNGYAALTFDDGPVANTPLLLDALAAKHAKATFFVIGSQVGGRTQDVARAAREGNVVGDHTWSHPDTFPFLLAFTDDQIRTELTKTSDAIAAAGAPRPTVWRPPHGFTDDHVEAIATGLGLSQALWTIDTWDWTGISVDDTVSRALQYMGAGAVVLFHERMDNTVAAVPAIIDGMRQRGLCPGVLQPASYRNPFLGGSVQIVPR